MNNLQNMKKKELLLAIFAGAIALFSFLALTFHVFRMTEDTESILALAGASGFGSQTNMNVFKMIEHLDDFTGAYKTYAILDIAALIGALGAIAYFVYALLFKSPEERIVIYKRILLIAIAITIFMLIQGIHLTDKTNDNFWMGVEMDGSTTREEMEAYGNFGYETECYWPIIIVGLLTIPYAIVLKKMPEDQAVVAPVVENVLQDVAVSETSSNEEAPIIEEEAPATESVPQNDDSQIDALKKWKALLDEGVITAEEFNAKKEEILK